MFYKVAALSNYYKQRYNNVYIKILSPSAQYELQIQASQTR